ncbi:hypothetical protein SAZ11_01705 [Streptomyces sp. FXJ1.4098]|uniref:hypothetical protein n=1 Tax=Streptomyces sp. NPDC020845 TaxID=3365096 RepID=UPI002993928B|nr:hypothetical protein [Streptomyces sp. FXJ1.4098]
MLTEEASYSEGGSRLAAYARPREAHTIFYYEGSGPAPLRRVMDRLAADPESFAILYDAERAYLAYYLERLGKDGLDPSVRGMELDWTELELAYVSDFIAELMSARAEAIEEGDILDADAFDRSVHRHSKGTYRTAAHRVTSHPAQDTIARRKAIPAREDGFLDGSEQLLLKSPAVEGARQRSRAAGGSRMHGATSGSAERSGLAQGSDRPDGGRASATLPGRGSRHGGA